MKILLLILLVGCASANFHDALKRASDEVVEDFISGMANAPFLHDALGIDGTEEVKQLESDIKEELAQYIREQFDAALEKILNAIRNGKKVHEKALEHLKQLKEDMTKLSITDDDIAKKEIQEIKDRVTGTLKEILIKMGIIESEKRSIANADDDDDDDILGDINIRNFIIKMKQVILQKMDVEQLKKSIAKLVGQGTQKLCTWLTDKGKEKVINFFDRLLDEDDDKKKRSISDLYQQIKEYFDGLDLDFKQKFFKFGEWVKEVLEKGLEKSKSRIEKIKTIANQLMDKSKVISKEVAEQAIEYLKDYKEELGDLYLQVMYKLYQVIDKYTD